MEMNETNLCTHVQFIIIIAVVFLNTPLALDLDNINNQTKMSMVTHDLLKCIWCAHYIIIQQIGFKLWEYYVDDYGHGTNLSY
ncbi:hypothetical protein DERF_006616 [Dermatophagoides farinae]|uniref:Transmembrane protein n=1 Tax=Dermatophagoides farinae TaxID=6954 RepID=A0A922HWH6_DERFA|nr:hypothetical protein DERF_006616 [Dermatophagoides farinae]